MNDRVTQFTWGLAGALLVAFLVFTVGVDQLSTGIGPFFLMALLLLGAFVAFVAVLNRARGGELLHAERAATIGEPGAAHFLFHDLRSAPLWLVVRLYVGFAWLEAGYHKATGTGWLDGGNALKGYWTKAVAVDPKTGTGPISYDWYRHFLQFMLDQQWYTWFGTVIVVGELLIGLGMLFGVLTGWAAFFGLLMNMSFMLAGSASTNPVLFSLSILPSSPGAWPATSAATAWSCRLSACRDSSDRRPAPGAAPPESGQRPPPVDGAALGIPGQHTSARDQALWR